MKNNDMKNKINNKIKYTLYYTDIDQKIDRIQEMVRNQRITSDLGEALIKYYIKRDISNSINKDLEDFFQGNITKLKKLFFLNYERKRTKYIE